MLDTEEVTDTTVLEDCWNEWHCESTHIAQGNQPCLHTPVAMTMYSCHKRHTIVCQTHVDHVIRAQKAGKVCQECKVSGRGIFRVAEAWRIVPLNL